jgi:hypothetical protein
MAAINLPDGAVITEVVVYYEYTLLLGSMTINFTRKALATGNSQTISTGTTPLLGLGIQTSTLGVTGGNATVDNSTYSYRIQVGFSLPGTQRIHGIRIRYTK